MYPWVREKKKRYLYKEDYYIIMAMPFLYIKESNVPQAHIEKGLIVSKESNLVLILLLVNREFDEFLKR